MGKQQPEVWYDPQLEQEVEVVNAQGQEVVDPTPLEPPIGYVKQPTLHDQIRMAILSNDLRRAAEEAGVETFEEADDFEIGDDYDPSSPWENEFDPPFSEIRREVERLKNRGVAVPSDVQEMLDGSEEEPVRQDPQPKKAKVAKAEAKERKGAEDDPS